jgi:hypothetical protein
MYPCTSPSGSSKGPLTHTHTLLSHTIYLVVLLFFTHLLCVGHVHSSFYGPPYTPTTHPPRNPSTAREHAASPPPQEPFSIISINIIAQPKKCRVCAKLYHNLIGLEHCRGEYTPPSTLVGNYRDSASLERACAGSILYSTA